MKKLAAALLTLLAVCVFASCAKGELESPAPTGTPAPSPAPTPTEAPALSSPTPEEPPEPETGSISGITDLMHTEIIDITPGYVLIVAGWYPKTGVDAIDSYYSDKREEFTANAENLAEELRSYGETNSAATQYMFDDNYEIVKNSGDIFSVHRTVYRYTGGVNGVHSDVCDNFRISDGKRLTLDDIFDCSREEYIADICGVFDAFIDEHNSGGDDYYFFNDAKVILRDIFPMHAFCLTDTGLNFYISPYFVTPYSSGTVVSPVAWDDLTVARHD
ncbi:MAG: DUF4163 domain-containing protein [Clostridiales bacterium]|nr:DUF4163 domain-containing protein [Clostridiales bacterium]